MKYKYILFDLDDTILDFKKSEKETIKKIYDIYYLEHDIDFNKFCNIIKKIEKYLWKQVEQNKLSPSQACFERIRFLNTYLNIKLDDIAIAFEYNSYLGHLCDWLPYAKESLDELLKLGVVMGIITNGYSYTQHIKYKKHKLNKWFKCYIIADEIGIAKPDVEIFNKAFEELNIDPTKDKILMVGDSLTADKIGSLNAQIDFCYINNNVNANKDIHTKYVIKDLRELVKIINNTSFSF